MKYFLFFLLTIVSCTPDRSNPESLLKSYIEKRFKNKMSKEEVLSYLDGELKSNVEKMGDEEFEEFTSLGEFKLKSIKINGKTCQDSLCKINYSLHYEQQSSETQTKKIAELVLIEKEWRIKSITNLKTFHDLKEESL